MDKLKLEQTANQLRKHIITSLHGAKCGHPGGSLSAADIVTYLYYEEMNIDPSDPNKADRDRFVLSKGHAAPALYGVLAMKGFFPVEELSKLRKTGEMLQGHPDMKKTPGQKSGSVIRRMVRREPSIERACRVRSIISSLRQRRIFEEMILPKGLSPRRSRFSSVRQRRMVRREPYFSSCEAL